MKHSYEIQGMHCGSCVEKVERGLRSIEGVTNAQVTLLEAACASCLE